MMFNCFKYKNACFEVFFYKIVKFTLANFRIWHQCSLKAGTGYKILRLLDKKPKRKIF